jgi:hypothetical protein
MEQVPSLDRRGLRRFGLLTGAILVLLFGMALPWILDHSYPTWPWLVAVPLWALALLLPDGLKPIYRVWMRFGAVLGAVNAAIILGMVFYALITPIALTLRWLGHDALNRRLDQRASYRVPSRAPSPKHMERPF